MATQLHINECIDSKDMAIARKNELDLPRDLAVSLGNEAVEIVRSGKYRSPRGTEVVIAEAVSKAIASKLSIPPATVLPAASNGGFETTVVEVANETTLGAARRLRALGHEPLALNFANGKYAGGGFLSGARAQEETLCRSGALFATLDGDPMYAAHARRPTPDSTDWCILSPEVPIFRTDQGTLLEEPWNLSIITCAAPVASRIGQGKAIVLMRQRIERILMVAHAYGYEALVLGAWGCGAFGNDPRETAKALFAALEGPMAGCFRYVVFAVTDWSDERRFLGPFRDEAAARPRIQSTT